MNKWADVASSIVMVALITTLVAHKETSSAINAAGNAFANSIRAAMGK